MIATVRVLTLGALATLASLAFTLEPDLIAARLTSYSYPWEGLPARTVFGTQEFALVQYRVDPPPGAGWAVSLQLDDQPEYDIVGGSPETSGSIEDFAWMIFIKEPAGPHSITLRAYAIDGVSGTRTQTDRADLPFEVVSLAIAASAEAVPLGGTLTVSASTIGASPDATIIWQTNPPVPIASPGALTYTFSPDRIGLSSATAYLNDRGAQAYAYVPYVVYDPNAVPVTGHGEAGDAGLDFDVGVRYRNGEAVGRVNLSDAAGSLRSKSIRWYIVELMSDGSAYATIAGDGTWNGAEVRFKVTLVDTPTGSWESAGLSIDVGDSTIHTNRGFVTKGRVTILPSGHG